MQLINRNNLSIAAVIMAIVITSIAFGPSLNAVVAPQTTEYGSIEDGNTSEPSFFVTQVNSGNGATTEPPVQQAAPPVANLKPFKTYGKSSFIMAGVGLRNVGSGTISLHKPVDSTLEAAWLYVTFLDDPNPTNPNLPAHPEIGRISFNGQMMNGKLIASDGSPCWAGKIWVYRYDVTSNLSKRGGSIDDQYISVSSAIVDSKSPWAGFAIPAAESAHLIIVYNDNTSTSTVKIFDAAGPGITFGGGSATFTAGGFTPHVAGSPAFVGYGLADGQLVTGSKTFDYNGGSTPVTLNSGEIYGRDPSINSKASVHGSLSDTEVYNVTANTAAGATSSTLTWGFAGDCITTVVVVQEM